MKETVTICGGVSEKDIEIIPYPFKWRIKNCTCKNVRKWHQDWYGWTIDHEKSCALLNHPLCNLIQYAELGPLCQSE